MAPLEPEGLDMNNVIAWPGGRAAQKKSVSTKDAACLRIQVRRACYTIMLANRTQQTLTMRDPALRPQTV